MNIASRDQWPPDSFIGQLSAAERAALLATGTPARFTDGAILMLQGEAGDYLYVVTGGLVKIIVTAESGAETTIVVRARGDLVGEFALLDDKPRTATARAAGEVTVAKIGAAAFLAVFNESAALQLAVTRYILAKVRSSTERRAAERVWDAKERLAQVLYQLGEMHADPDAAGPVRVPLTQSEVGELAGVAVSTTERVLKDLRKQGVVTTGYREIIIRDMEWLRGLRFS